MGDVQRTFPNCPAFQEEGGPDQLRRVLRSLAANDTELGYCQSLNFIAGVFVMVLRDERAAVLAVQQLFVKLGTRMWYTDGMRQLRADTCVLEDLLQERLTGVFRVLRRYKFDLLFVTSKWFLCLFATTLEGEALDVTPHTQTSGNELIQGQHTTVVSVYKEKSESACETSMPRA